MTQYFWSTIIATILWLPINAQTSPLQITVISKTNHLELTGASVYFNTLKKEKFTNLNGIVEFKIRPDTKQQIKISLLGFNTIDTLIHTSNRKKLIFELTENINELKTVTLFSTRNTRTIKKTPTRVEFINEEELSEKAIMNPTNISMVLRESTGIQMQQTSLSSGSTNIRIQGLDGRYTQLLRDGFPLYGGFSSGLSILQIPPLDLHQFEIIKGSSSTLYGGGAIAGLVNMTSKTPKEEPTLDIMLTQTQALGSTANVFYSKRNKKFGVSLYGSGHYQKIYDPEGDDFSNLPQTNTISFNPKFFYFPSDQTTFRFGINGTYDNRIGGDVTAIEKEINDLHQYTEENKSKRISSQFVYKTQLSKKNSIEIKNSVSYFNRDLSVPDFNFKGKQINTFTEISYNNTSKTSDWITGINLYSSNFKENDIAPLQRDQKDLTIGTFLNYVYDFSDQFILESGFRTDYNTDYGFFTLPRISLLYKNKNGFSSRIGGGLGYKIPDIFTEEAEYINFNNIIAIDKSIVNPEKSYGFNFDLNYKTHLFNDLFFTINQLFYTTTIENGLLLEPIDHNFYTFKNATDNILSNGAETNIKFSYNNFRWFINYAFIDTQLKYLTNNPQKPLTAKHNAGSVLMYESEKWRIGYETYYTGTQLLSNGAKTTDFITMGLLLMHHFKFGSIFTNFENFTDAKQSNYSSLVLPPHNNPVFPEIYAPTDGFILSLGVIIKPFGNHHDH